MRRPCTSPGPRAGAGAHQQQDKRQQIRIFLSRAKAHQRPHPLTSWAEAHQRQSISKHTQKYQLGKSTPANQRKSHPQTRSSSPGQRHTGILSPLQRFRLSIIKSTAHSSCAASRVFATPMPPARSNASQVPVSANKQEPTKSTLQATPSREREYMYTSAKVAVYHE